MCGIAGCWSSVENFDPMVAVDAMVERLESRGPDDSGVWGDDAAAGFALGHRRLAIVDLSPAGHQPMTSPCGRYVLVYNGEIYNHADLRAELESEGGHFDWEGQSDTETLLAALRCWGIEKALTRLNGMFAFALWDRNDRSLFMARDRMGEKPLYYGRHGENFLFGSELKALAAHPAWAGKVDRDALVSFLRHGYVQSPRSIYSGINKLPAGHYVVVRENGTVVGEPRCYWDLGNVAEKGLASAGSSPHTATNELHELLADAVRSRMMADVPIGAFLSGGYDSSVVAALMQAQSERAIKTFSIGFKESSYNEAQHAKAVADHLGTDHAELYVTPDQAMDVIPKLPTIYDEPFSDASQIPMYLVSQLARHHVTVSLSGDGGDELFCGYDRYFVADRIWQVLRYLPAAARRVLSSAIARTPGAAVQCVQQNFPRAFQVSNLSDRLPKIAALLAHRNASAFYQGLISHCQDPAQWVVGGQERQAAENAPFGRLRSAELHERMMFHDQLTYLPDDILTKLDRASMAVGLETRVPLLDHRLLEFAWRTPLSHKVQNGQPKWLLKQVLYRYVPRELMERPKMGFSVPIEHWLRGPLRDWAEDLLDAQRLRSEGFFDADRVRSMWHEHLSGKRRWHYRLWDILMFEAWYRQWLCGGADLTAA